MRSAGWKETDAKMGIERERENIDRKRELMANKSPNHRSSLK